MRRKLLTMCAAVGLLVATTTQTQALTWTEVMDQTVISTSSESLTRSLRGLALSDDGTQIYGGFIQKSQGSGVRQYTLAGDPPVGTAGNFFNVTAIPPSGADHQPKAVATDDRGVVFVGSSKGSTSGDNARIFIMNSNLTAHTLVVLNDIDNPGVTGETVGGLSVVRSGSDLHLYVSREHSNSAYVERYVIGGNDHTDATLTLDTSFNGTGRFNIQTDGGIPSASNLRGIEVADDGTIFVVSRDNSGGMVYRIASDLSNVMTMPVNLAIDLALYDSRVFVTSYNGANSAIFELLQSNLTVLGSFDAFDDFSRAIHGAAGDVAGYAGIDIDAQGRIYLVDQLYFRDSNESRDRILVSSPLALLQFQAPIPEPAVAGMVLVGMAGLIARRRRIA